MLKEVAAKTDPEQATILDSKGRPLNTPKLAPRPPGNPAPTLDLGSGKVTAGTVPFTGKRD